MFTGMNFYNKGAVMKTTKFIAIIVLLCGLGACTKNNFIDTGICNGRFDGSLLEYLEAPANSYNWDSTALMAVSYTHLFIYGHEASSDVISGYSTVERSGACFELQLFVR